MWGNIRSEFALPDREIRKFSLPGLFSCDPVEAIFRVFCVECYLNSPCNGFWLKQQVDFQNQWLVR